MKTWKNRLENASLWGCALIAIGLLIALVHFFTLVAGYVLKILEKAAR